MGLIIGTVAKLLCGWMASDTDEQSGGAILKRGQNKIKIFPSHTLYAMYYYKKVSVVSIVHALV